MRNFKRKWTLDRTKYRTAPEVTELRRVVEQRARADLGIVVGTSPNDPRLSPRQLHTSHSPTAPQGVGSVRSVKCAECPTDAPGNAHVSATGGAILLLRR